MPTFCCEEIRPLRNLNAYLSRKGDLALLGRDVFKSTGKHILSFSIRNPDESGSKYIFNFLGYKSEFDFIGSFLPNKFSTTLHIGRNSLNAFGGKDSLRFSDASVLNLIARMNLTNSYNIDVLLDKFKYKKKNYSFGWDSSIYTPDLDDYRGKKEYIGINLHIDENGSISIEPSDYNTVVRYRNNIYLECIMREGFEELNYKHFYTGYSPYSIPRYSFLYDALISVFDVEPIKEGV